MGKKQARRTENEGGAEDMGAEQVLLRAGEAAGAWPAQMPGHVVFGDDAPDAGELDDGAHRLEGSPWQVVVEGGRVVQAIREDQRNWWRDEHVVHVKTGAAAADEGEEAGSGQD